MPYSAGNSNGVYAEKRKSRRREKTPSVGQTNTENRAALPRPRYFMAHHLLLSTGFNAPKALGSSQ